MTRLFWWLAARVLIFYARVRFGIQGFIVGYNAVDRELIRAERLRKLMGKDDVL